MSTQQNDANGGTPLAEPTGSAIMVSDGDKLAKGDEYLCDDGTWKTLEPIWIGVTYTKWLMVPMRRPNIVFVVD